MVEFFACPCSVRKGLRATPSHFLGKANKGGVAGGCAKEIGRRRDNAAEWFCRY